MAVSRRKGRKGWKTGRLHWPGSGHRQGERDSHKADEAARLTPLEETEAFKDSPQSDGKHNADTIRVADTIDTLRDMLGSTMDAYLSIQGNRMNMIMKRLTSVATVLMSVTLVAGIYGMNFEFMPELHWRFGYVFALLAMLFIGLVLYFYLRRVKWL